jgi:hypothetical protein
MAKKRKEPEVFQPAKEGVVTVKDVIARGSGITQVPKTMTIDEANHEIGRLGRVVKQQADEIEELYARLDALENIEPDEDPPEDPDKGEE